MNALSKVLSPSKIAALSPSMLHMFGDATQHAGKMLGSQGFRGYGTAAGLGAGLGAASGLIAPGSHTDANGNEVENSRIGAMLSRAGAGSALGAGARFAGGRLGAGKALDRAGQEMHMSAGLPPSPGPALPPRPGPSLGQAPAAGLGKGAALQMVRDDIYFVADRNGDAFVGTYKGANIDNKAVFEVHAPGFKSAAYAFDMRGLGHIHPVKIAGTNKIARSREDLPHTIEGQKLAEFYGLKLAAATKNASTTKLEPAAAAATEASKEAKANTTPANGPNTGAGTIGSGEPSLPEIRARRAKK